MNQGFIHILLCGIIILLASQQEVSVVHKSMCE